MLQNIRKRKEGFTIIEVLIVLAIVGVIMLVVFLAVPALQRSSRNNQAKSAAGAILSTVNEFIDVNGGQMPASVAISNGTITASGTTGDGSTSTTGKTQGAYAIETGNDPTGTGKFIVGLNKKCNGNAFANASRAISVRYFAETSGGTATQCVEG